LKDGVGLSSSAMIENQKEKEISEQIAKDAVVAAMASETPLDEKFIEESAKVIHRKWLQRNKDHARAMDLLPYAQLSEEEKEKDRIFVREAILKYKK
jgi:hypothetical protein